MGHAPVVAAAAPPPSPPDQPLLLSLHYTNPLLISAGTGAALVLARTFHLRFLKRFKTIDDIGPDQLRGRRIRGVVTRCVQQRPSRPDKGQRWRRRQLSDLAHAVDSMETCNPYDQGRSVVLSVWRT